MSKEIRHEKCTSDKLAPSSKTNDLPRAKGSNRHVKALLGVSAFQDLPDCARVRQPVVELLHGISSATLWRRVKSGSLPKPRLDGRVASWSAGEIRATLRGVK